ncbi:response regulator transcription factor [soil metagenome]
MSKILLVEDDLSLVATVDQWLSAENYTVETASDGLEGWARLQFEKFDLIVMDWNLPEISGLELCKRFRAEKGLTPVIMLTGRSAVAEKEAGLDAGADDYLTKPFSMKELSARIRALLRRPPTYQTNALALDGICLDPGKHRVTKNGKDVHLLPRDFSLLEFFMRHPDEVFGAEALLQRVWHSDSDATADGLRTAIKRLRQKLDDSEKEHDSIIENIPRVGYRLRVKRST